MFTLNPSGKYVDLFALYGIQNLGGNVYEMLVLGKQLTVKVDEGHSGAIWRCGRIPSQ